MGSLNCWSEIRYIYLEKWILVLQMYKPPRAHVRSNERKNKSQVLSIEVLFGFSTPIAILHQSKSSQFLSVLKKSTDLLLSLSPLIEKWKIKKNSLDNILIFHLRNVFKLLKITFDFIMLHFTFLHQLNEILLLSHLEIEIHERVEGSQGQ